MGFVAADAQWKFKSRQRWSGTGFSGGDAQTLTEDDLFFSFRLWIFTPPPLSHSLGISLDIHSAYISCLYINYTSSLKSMKINFDVNGYSFIVLYPGRTMMAGPGSPEANLGLTPEDRRPPAKRWATHCGPILIWIQQSSFNWGWGRLQVFVVRLCSKVLVHSITSFYTNLVDR